MILDFKMQLLLKLCYADRFVLCMRFIRRSWTSKMTKLFIVSACLAFTLGLLQMISAHASSSETFMPHSDNFNDTSLDIAYWTKIEDDVGITVEETGMEILVSGTSNDTAWGKNGLRTASFPKQSFQASIDYKLVNMTDLQMTNLRLYFDGGAHYFSIGFGDFSDDYFAAYMDAEGYHVLPNTVPAFGDEGTAFHTLSLIFNSSTNTVLGYIDNVLVDSLTSSDFFKSPMYIQFSQSSNIAGSFDVDCRFDNFSIEAVQ